MSFDVDLHRITISLPGRLANGKPLEMSAVDAGPRDAAQTMVFLHGFGGRAAYWEYQLEHFQSDYRVIALDLRGHGYSDAPTEAEGAHYDVPELVADIEAALDALQVPQQFILVCHSFGGALSSYFLDRYPQRVTALVIIASAVQFRLRTAGRMLLQVPPAILNWLRKALPYVGFNMAHLYPPTHVVYLQNRNALTKWDGSDYLRRIGVPSLVILGQRDTLFSDVSYRQVAQLIPGAEEVVIPVSAHQVMVERPDAVNRAIERFLQAQADPLVLAEHKATQRVQRRAARKALEAERPWLKFYDARTPYRIRMPLVPLPRLLEATARRFGKTAALYFRGREITWRELDRLADKFAGSLLAAGLRPGERVMLALPNIPQWPIAYFGVLKAAGVAVLADAGIDTATLRMRIAETRSVMLVSTTNRHAGLRAALTDNPGTLRQIILTAHIEYMGWREKLKFALLHHVQEGHRLPSQRPGSESPVFLRFSQMVLRGRRLAPDAVQSVNDTAIIAYTFGTGGRALPVPLTHRNLAANALQLRHWLPESRPGDERFLAHQPLSSAYGLTGLLHLGMYLGATLILLPDNDIPQLLKTVRKKRPTYFPTTPRMVRELMHTSGVRRFGLASIRVCAVSGSPLPQEVREEFEKITRGRLIEAFGLTEASPAVLAMPVATRRRAGALGLPLPDTEAKVIDLDSGQVCAPDIPGELWVRGPQVFAGYDGEHHHGLTTERLRDGWLATGDIASVDEDGFFTISDRKDNMLVRGGQRIFPRQIEEVLFEHPAVALAEVKSRLDETGLSHLQAEVILHRNMRISPEELRQYCAKRLHPGALPDSIHLKQEAAS